MNWLTDFVHWWAGLTWVPATIWTLLLAIVLCAAYMTLKAWRKGAPRRAARRERSQNRVRIEALKEEQRWWNARSSHGIIDQLQIPQSQKDFR
jgi:membrane protein implicated in regulation of membrane protease activity